MSNETGIVEVLTSKPAGNGIAWSMKVNNVWYGLGFTQPKFQKGDNVTFTWKANGNFKNVDPRTVQVLGAAEQAPPQQAPSSAPQARAPAGPNPTQLAIQWQASRNSAIEAVRLGVEHGAVSLPTKKADQFDAIKAIVFDTSVEYFLETQKVMEDGGVENSELEQVQGTPAGDF